MAANLERVRVADALKAPIDKESPVLVRKQQRAKNESVRNRRLDATAVEHKCSMVNACLNHIMRMYKMVGSVSDAESLILFPLGVVAILGTDTQGAEKLRKALLQSIIAFNISASHCPLIIFPRLGSEWSNCKPPEHLIESYQSQVGRICNALNEGKVAALDNRPANIMWQATELGVNVRLIDFEDVFAFGEVIPHDFIEQIRNMGDKRYPFPLTAQAEPLVASSKHNDFFHLAVTRWAASEIKRFSDFMDVYYSDIYSATMT